MENVINQILTEEEKKLLGLLSSSLLVVLEESDADAEKVDINTARAIMADNYSPYTIAMLAEPACVFCHNAEMLEERIKDAPEGPLYFVKVNSRLAIRWNGGLEKVKMGYF